MATPFPNESVLAANVPSFLKNKATKTTAIRTIKTPKENYENSSGYYTGYGPYFQYQQASNWCWIAVAVSLGNFKLKNYWAYDQRTLANKLLGGQYDSTGDPAFSMSACNCFRGREANYISAKRVLTELLNTCPLVVGFSPTWNSSHVAVISAAINASSSYYVVDDPWWGPGKQVNIGEMSSSVLGTWYTTFYYAS